jgi:hypothetical protein
MNIAVMIPARSAISEAGIAYLVFLIPTDPKYSATI